MKLPNVGSTFWLCSNILTVLQYIPFPKSFGLNKLFTFEFIFPLPLSLGVVGWFEVIVSAPTQLRGVETWRNSYFGPYESGPRAWSDAIRVVQRLCARRYSAELSLSLPLRARNDATEEVLQAFVCFVCLRLAL